MPKKPVTPRRTWRDIPDASHTNRLSCWPSPESLHPSESTIVAALSGDESAQAILLSYAGPVVPVITVKVVAQ